MAFHCKWVTLYKYLRNVKVSLKIETDMKPLLIVETSMKSHALLISFGFPAILG